MRITKINEYRNLDALCIEDSYYECLAKRLLLTDISNESKCSELCSPFSLPPVDNHTIPICKQLDCGLIMDNTIKHLKSSQAEVCKKACQVKEFEFGETSANRDVMPGYPKTINSPGKLFEMEIKFDTPYSTKDIRSEELFKNVMTEYLIVTTMSLVGVVGGTLGMFAGFSFFGVTEWFIAVASVELQKLTKITSKEKPRSPAKTINVEIA